MKPFICTDIFGITSALIHLVDTLQLSERVTFIDPHSGLVDGFSDEGVAYQAFTERGGINGYIQTINDALLQYSSEPVQIIGFSAGAAAAYVGLNQKNNATQNRLFGFYPGQIRHYLALDNRLECCLVFPHQEAHFELDAVCESLRQQPLLEQTRTEYEHGFMNPLSKGFSRQGQAEYAEILQRWLR